MNQMTPKGKPMTRTEQETAADAFLEVLDLHLTAIANARVSDLRKALAPDVSATDIDDIASAVFNAVRTTDGVVRTASGGQMVETFARNRLATIQAKVESALATFDKQGDLELAERKVAKLEGGLVDARKGLDAAVESGDLDAVLRLRGECEVILPRKVAEAKVAVLDLKILRSESLQAAPAGRTSSANVELERAQKTVVEAMSSLTTAQESLHHAQTAASQAHQATASGAQYLEVLQTERRRVAESIATEAAAAIRRMAGLTLEEEVDDAPHGNEDESTRATGHHHFHQTASA